MTDFDGILWHKTLLNMCEKNQNQNICLLFTVSYCVGYVCYAGLIYFFFFLFQLVTMLDMVSQEKIVVVIILAHNVAEHMFISTLCKLILSMNVTKNHSLSVNFVGKAFTILQTTRNT